MQHKIEQWIDLTNKEFANKRISCSRFKHEFKGYYSEDFLKDAFYVVVDKLPKPRFKELRDMGFGDFLDTEFDAITYKNTYYVKSTVENMLELHFHELVHVIQWNHLGASKFLDQYINEIRNVGYKNAPLEKMAYSLQDNYVGRYQQIDIESYVEQNLGQRF